MNFMEPIFLAGLIGALLPLIVHLINRKKAVKVPFPAIKFLLQSQKKVARSIKIRQWLLLALRMLAVALLAIALAKPFFKSQQGVTADERLPTATVFVMDTSYSMAQGDWWSRATDALEDEVKRVRPWDEVALVLTGGEGSMSALTSDHTSVKRLASELKVGQHAKPLTDAVLEASDMLGPSQLPNKRIVVITDGSTGAMLPGPLPDVPWSMEFITVRDDQTPESLAISDVSFVQEGARRERQWKIDATVVNKGTKAKKVDVQLVMDGQVVAAGKVDVEAGKSAIYTFRHRLETQAAQVARVELVDADALEVDNTRWFSLHMSDRVRVLLVNGEPSSVVYNDELFFLERALLPRQDSSSGITVTVASRDGLEGREFKDFDVIVMANVSVVSQDVANRLKAHVEQGGGLFLTMGGQVDVNNWNQLFADILPKPLRSLKQLAEVGDPDAPIKITRFGVSKVDHGIFEAFEAPGGGALQSAQVYSYMLLEPSPPDAATSILLSYKDGAPALIERELGAGRVVMLTTSIDLDWTDLPTRTAYLPLTRRIVQYLARRATSEGRVTHVVGDEVEVDVRGLGAERIIARGQGAMRLVQTPDAEGLVRFSPPEAGVYEVYLNDEKPDSRLASLDFSINVDVREANLEPLPETMFSAWKTQDTKDGVFQEERRVNLWPKLLFAFTMMLLFESVLGTRRSVLLRIWRWITRRPQDADVPQP